MADDLTEGAVVLVTTSPRTPAGLLTAAAWDALRGAAAVYAAAPDPGWEQALADAGVQVSDLASEPVPVRAGRLVEQAAAGRSVAWLGSPDGDPGFTDALAEHLARHAVAGRPPQVEIVAGSWDVPGSRLLDLVTVMDVLRSPGGCPWDADQTHASLLPYLLEETHEVIEAVERDDRAHMREELGDLLLQVVFHARVAAEHEDDPFDVDDVAAGIVDKLVRRHPHVFADGLAPDAASVDARWEELKAAEKQRDRLFDGIPATLPSLARAQKMLDRLERAVGPAGATAAGGVAAASAGDAAAVVTALLDAVAAARAAGVDAEAVLRAALAHLPEG